MLSYREESLLSIIENVEIIAIWQARLILEKYLGCSNDQSRIIIEQMVKQGCLRVTQSDYLIISGKGTHFNKKLVAGITVALMFASGMDTINSIMRGTSVYDVTFIEGNTIYNCTSVDIGNIAKLKALEMHYHKIGKNIKLSKISYQTVLIFSNTVDKNDVFEQLDAMELDFPYIITFIPEKQNAPIVDIPFYQLDTEE